MKVLHLPSRVGGNAWALSRAEREWGIESDVLFLDGASLFQQPSDIPADNLMSGNRLQRFFRIAKFYKEACKAYDVLHFNWGSTPLSWPDSPWPPFELSWLKRMGATIAVTYQGTDARQEDYCLRHYEITHASAYDEEELKRCERVSARKRSHIATFEKHADIIYTTNPDLMNVLPNRARFRPYTKCDIAQIEPYGLEPHDGPLRLVHAPTDRAKKGTTHLLEAVERLKTEGYAVELLLVEGLTNDEALRLYRQADVVIDQLLIGWYGGFAVECMAMGKPVMCYLREGDLRHIPEAMREEMPIINASPYTVYEKLRKVLDGELKLKALVGASRSYVENWHDCKKNARRVIEDYNEALTAGIP